MVKNLTAEDCCFLVIENQKILSKRDTAAPEGNAKLSSTTSLRYIIGMAADWWHLFNVIIYNKSSNYLNFFNSMIKKFGRKYAYLPSTGSSSNLRSQPMVGPSLGKISATLWTSLSPLPDILITRCCSGFIVFASSQAP